MSNLSEVSWDERMNILSSLFLNNSFSSSIEVFELLIFEERFKTGVFKVLRSEMLIGEVGTEAEEISSCSSICFGRLLIRTVATRTYTEKTIQRILIINGTLKAISSLKNINSYWSKGKLGSEGTFGETP